jgi:hypothetical protein
LVNGVAVVDFDEVVGRFLQRAKELRRIADNVKDADCRDTLLAWAADDDRLVDEAIEANAPAECWTLLYPPSAQSRTL